MLKRFVIIVFLLSLIISPRIFLGMRNEQLAQEALINKDFKHAAEEYELAARRLLWQRDLWEKAGLLRFELGDIDAAKSAFQKAAKINALSAAGWDAYGYTFENKNDSLSIWREGLAHYPRYYKFYQNLALLYYDSGNLSAEKEALEKWIAHADNDKNSGFFHYRYGLLLMPTSPDEALDELTRAAHADERFAPVVETLCASLNLALLKSDPAEKAILLGRGLGLVEEWQLAAQIFTNTTQAYPTSASAWALLGEAKQHLGQDSLPDLDKAINLQPNSALIHSLRGLYWQRQGKLEEALSEFQAAVKIEPENPNYQTALGEIYARLGDIPLALMAYEQATVLMPEEPLYWHLLALFSAEYAVQVDGVGLPAAQKAVNLSPKNAAFTDTLGWVYFGLERDEEAREQFFSALELDPNLGVAHLHLGMLYLKRGHWDLARQSLWRARELSQADFAGEQAARLLNEYFKE